MTRTIEAIPSGRDGSGASRLIVAVALPLAVTAIAYGLWWVSDRWLGVGPLDRAQFGWLVVMPTWLAAPVVAAFAWRPLDRRATAAAATIVTALIGGAASVLLWQSVAFPDCSSPIRTPMEQVVPSVIVGALIGLGLAVGGLVGVGPARDGRRLAAIVLAAGTGAGMFALALLVGLPLLFGPACDRPLV